MTVDSPSLHTDALITGRFLQLIYNDADSDPLDFARILETACSEWFMNQSTTMIY